MYLRFLTVLVLAFSFGIAAAGQNLPIDPALQRASLVGPGDEDVVKVLGESQFDFSTTVDENGRIEVPFSDTPLIAKCLSERDLRAAVTKHLTRYLKTPQINL